MDGALHRAAAPTLTLNSPSPQPSPAAQELLLDVAAIRVIGGKASPRAAAKHIDSLIAKREAALVESSASWQRRSTSLMALWDRVRKVARSKTLVCWDVLTVSDPSGAGKPDGAGGGAKGTGVAHKVSMKDFDIVDVLGSGGYGAHAPPAEGGGRSAGEGRRAQRGGPFGARAPHGPSSPPPLHTCAPPLRPLGTVYLARRRSTRDLVAIKALTKAHLRETNALANVQLERLILSSAQSPSVVQLYFSFASKANVYAPRRRSAAAPALLGGPSAAASTPTRLHAFIPTRLHAFTSTLLPACPLPIALSALTSATW